MISLSRHIELLLLEHDCVIVPGLGGFIANHASARYNEEGDNLFLPPYRNVCFNQNLQTNDGLLVQAYMTAYDSSYPAAYKQMSNDIEELSDILDIEGSYELSGIGVLNKGINDNITFTAYDSGILTPTLYGLYSINIKSKEMVERDKQIQQALQSTNVLPIQTEHTEHVAPTQTIVASIKEHSDKSPFKRKYSNFIDIAVACVASILLFFVFSYPTNHNTKDTDTYVASAVNINPEIKGNQRLAPEISSKKTIAEKQESTTEVTVAPIKTVVTVSATIAPSEDTYTIVLASGVRKDNAEYLIERLNKAGFPHAKFVKGNKMNRVVYSSYSTFDEATKELKVLKQENPLFKESWVYKNK